MQMILNDNISEGYWMMLNSVERSLNAIKIKYSYNKYDCI